MVLRIALLEAISPEEMKQLARTMYARALKGDMAAASLVLRYTVGVPPGANGSVASEVGAGLVGRA
jgi:hypothetical protein